MAGITGALARTYAYDAAGNTTGYSTVTVTATYNNAGRMKTLTKGGSTETILYNALGQRIQVSGDVNGAVLYAYDEAGHLLGEYDGTGALIEETVWLGDTPVATLRPSGSTVSIFYIHTDPLNTPREVTRPSDNVAMWTWNSDPFGTDAANPSPSGAGVFTYNLRFPGQLFDGQAGLHYNGYRDYDPAPGRYSQADPIGLSGRSYSTYAYVAGNPFTYADPSGLCKVLLEYSKVAANAYHISLYTSDPQGNMWFSGGPTRSPLSGGAKQEDRGWMDPNPWGRLRGAYGTIETLPVGPNTKVVVDDGEPCSCYNRSFQDTIDRVNSNNIPYSPIEQNSNSLAGTILRDAGVNVPSSAWPYWTPAYSLDLNHYWSLSNYPYK